MDPMPIQSIRVLHTYRSVVQTESTGVSKTPDFGSYPNGPAFLSGQGERSVSFVQRKGQRFPKPPIQVRILYETWDGRPRQKRKDTFPGRQKKSRKETSGVRKGSRPCRRTVELDRQTTDILPCRCVPARSLWRERKYPSDPGKDALPSGGGISPGPSVRSLSPHGRSFCMGF